MFSNDGAVFSDIENPKNISNADGDNDKLSQRTKKGSLGVQINGTNGFRNSSNTTTKNPLQPNLQKAVAEGMVSVVKSALMIDDGLLINSLDVNGFYPLHIAAQHNRVQIVNTLLDSGAVCDVYSLPEGVTPLYLACRFNSLEAAIILLERGANPNAQTSKGLTSLHVSSRYNNPEIVKLLVSHQDTNIECRECFTCSPLHYACYYGSHEVAKILIDHGADFEACALENFTVLHFAVIGGNEATLSAVIDSAVQRYLRSPVSVFSPQNFDNDFVLFLSAKNDTGNSALHCAMKSGNLEISKMLINYNLDPNASTNSNQTPLHVAAMCGGLEAVMLLLNAHAEINCQDKDMKTPLHYATTFGNEEVIKHLLDHGAKLDIQDVDNLTPFLCAVASGRVECGRLLLEYEADICALDKQGKSCVHIAVENDQEKMVTLLLQNKARYKLVNHSEPGLERTPLHYAAITANTKILEMILRCKPNCTLRDIHRKTALHLAVESGKPRFVEMLARSGLTAVFDRDDMLRTPLHYAAMNKRRKTCIILIQFGAEINGYDQNRWTPTTWAVKSGDQATVSVFLERESLIDDKDLEGNTLLHVACRSGHVDVTKLLLDNGAEILLNNDNMNCFDCAIQQQNSDVVMAIVKHNRWEEFLRVGRYDTQNAMSALIEHCPEAAEVVMDRCVQRSPTSITYNFRYLDPGPGDCSGPQRDRYFGLNDMVQHKRQDLLNHPLGRKLLNMKWKTFGQIIFIVNLFVYICFLGCLSTFLAHKRKEHVGFNSSYNPDLEEDLMNDPGFVRFASVFVEGCAAFQILKELYQMCKLGRRYFKDATNLLAWGLYGSAFLFMLPYLSKDVLLQSQTKVNWATGTVSVFLGYIYLILYLRILSCVGLYVAMYMEVIKTVTKVMSLFVIFILAFSQVFYILFKEQEAFDSGFKSFVKTTVMTIGEIDYATLFRYGFGTANSTAEDEQVPFPEISVLFFYVFLLAMPIVLMNLLIGLAVGDIDAIQQSAFLTNKSIKINFVTEVENKYPKFISTRLYKPEVTVNDNKLCRRFCGRNVDSAPIYDEDVENEDLREDQTTLQIREVKQELFKTRQQVKTLVAAMDKQHDILVALATINGIATGEYVAKETSQSQKWR